MPVAYLGLGSNLDAEKNLHLAARELHEAAGRRRGPDKFVARTLDIDLLLYDELVVDEAPFRLPRQDVLLYSFVLKPLAEIAPDYRHPVTGRKLSEHWQEFATEIHPLTKIDLVL